MAFRTLTLLFLTLAVCTYCATAESATEMADNLKTLAGLADSYQQNFQSIRTAEDGFIKGQQLFEGNTDISSRLFQYTLAINPTPDTPIVPATKFSDAEGELVLAALEMYVSSQQKMLQTEQSRSYIPTLKITYAAPIFSSLRALETSVNTYCFYVVNSVPTQQPAAQAQCDDLITTIVETQTYYQTPV